MTERRVDNTARAEYIRRREGFSSHSSMFADPLLIVFRFRRKREQNWDQESAESEPDALAGGEAMSDSD